MERRDKLGPSSPPVQVHLRVENNYFTEMYSGSEAGSYLRLTDFVYHSPIGLRVIKKKKVEGVEGRDKLGPSSPPVQVHLLICAEFRAKRD